MGVMVDSCSSSLSLLFLLCVSSPKPTDWGDLLEAAGGPHQVTAGFAARCREEGGRWALSAEGISYNWGQAAVSLLAEPGAGGSSCMKETYIFKRKSSHQNLNNGPILLFDVVLLQLFLGIQTPSQEICWEHLKYTTMSLQVSSPLTLIYFPKWKNSMYTSTGITPHSNIHAYMTTVRCRQLSRCKWKHSSSRLKCELFLHQTYCHQSVGS